MRFIRLLLTGDRYEAFHGDIQEEYSRRVNVIGSARARLWYWKEVLLMLLHATWRWILAASIVGAVLGLSAYYVGTVSTLGPLAILPYALGILLPIALFRARPGRTFLLRFLTSFAAFMTMFGTHYVTMVNFDSRVHSVGLWGQTWRIGLMIAFATIAGLCGALMSRERPRSLYSAPLAIAVLGFGAMWLVHSLSLSVAALVTALLATSGFLRNHRVQPFARRFTIALGVNAVIAGLVCFYLVTLANPPWATWRFWALLFQRGGLYLEIVFISLAIAALTNTRDEQVNAEQQNSEPDEAPIPVG